MSASAHRVSTSPVGSVSLSAAPAAAADVTAVAMPALLLPSACASRAGCAAARRVSRGASSAINQARESEDAPAFMGVGGAAAAEDEPDILSGEAGERRATASGPPSVLSALSAPKTLYPPDEQDAEVHILQQGAADGEKEKDKKLSRRPKGAGAKRRRDERRRDEGISAAQPARSIVAPAPRLIPPPRPPPGPPPPWSVPVPSQGWSRHLVWINAAAPPRPPPRAARHPRVAQHPIARAQQRASNAVAAASRATAGAQAVAQHAAEIAATATRLVAERHAPAASLAPPAPPAPPSCCSASLVFEGTLPQPEHGNASWHEGENSRVISAIFEHQHAFLCIPDETFDGVPIYVMEDGLGGESEVVLYRVPSREDAAGSVWAIRWGDVLLAYGIDERDVRDAPGFEAAHGGPDWFIGNLHEPKPTDVRAPGFRLVSTFPVQRATRAAMGIELAPVASRP